MSEPNSPSSQFEYSINENEYNYQDYGFRTSQVNNTEEKTTPLQTRISKESGDIIYYLDLLHQRSGQPIGFDPTNLNIYCPDKKHYTIKIVKKSENNDKLLIHFKLGFDAKNYRENELATINQWKQWHETANLRPNNSFVEFRQNFDAKDLFNVDTNCAPNVKTFLWDPAQAAKPNEANFKVNFGCHSTQFPILWNNQYVASLLVLSIDIYSVATKQKIDCVSFKLKISRTDSSQFKLNSNEDLNTQNVQEIVQEDSIEQNVQELLTELNIQNNSEVLLPSYEQLNAIQLEQGLLLYRVESAKPSIATSRSVPVVFIQKKNPVYSYLPDIAYLKVELTNSHFDKFFNKNQLVKSVFTLQSSPITRNNRTYEFAQDTIDQTCQYSNSGKSLLQFCSDKQIRDNFLFDVNSPRFDQLCLIWRPLVEQSLSFKLNIGETDEMNSPTKFDIFLRVETFIAPNSTRNNWTKVDGAVCKLNFFINELPSYNKSGHFTGLITPRTNNIRSGIRHYYPLHDERIFNGVPSNIYTNAHHYIYLKNDSEYLIKKAFFISVDGSAYEPLLFQGPFLQENYLIEQFKTKFIALVREIKNIDSQFEIKKFNYFESDQSKQGCPFDSSIFFKLKPKTILKCNLRKVGENPQQERPQFDQYDVDLINQDENYSKAYF